jgi:hypothetical protein
MYWAVHSRFYDIDFAGSYIAIATKPAKVGREPGTRIFTRSKTF